MPCAALESTNESVMRAVTRYIHGDSASSISQGGNRLLASANSWGEVVSLSRCPARSSAGLLCFLSIARFARKETVSGYLTPTSGTAKMFVPQQGFIKEIKVK